MLGTAEFWFILSLLISFSISHFLLERKLVRSGDCWTLNTMSSWNIDCHKRYCLRICLESCKAHPAQLCNLSSTGTPAHHPLTPVGIPMYVSARESGDQEILFLRCLPAAGSSALLVGWLIKSGLAAGADRFVTMSPSVSRAQRCHRTRAGSGRLGGGYTVIQPAATGELQSVTTR